MRQLEAKRAVLTGVVLAAALILTLVPFSAQDAQPPQDAPKPPPQDAPKPPAQEPQKPPAPEPPAGQAPGAQAAPAAPAAPAQAPAPPAAPLPRIIRVVCTDHICGHCDGKCHRGSGHVAVDKKGHCACTPDAGSPLDQATRAAYEKSQPQ